MEPTGDPVTFDQIQHSNRFLDIHGNYEPGLVPGPSHLDRAARKITIIRLMQEASNGLDLTHSNHHVFYKCAPRVEPIHSPSIREKYVDFCSSGLNADLLFLAIG